MHYMFASEQKVRNFLQNATSRLIHGGFLVCSHPDANVIVKKLREEGVWDEKAQAWVAENKYYSLITETKEFPKSHGPFGFPYGFFLTDNLVGFREEKEDKDLLHYVPEYLVIVPALQEIAKEYGLEMVESKNMHEFFSENINTQEGKTRDNFDLFSKRMKFIAEPGATILMDKELWDVSYLYR